MSDTLTLTLTTKQAVLLNVILDVKLVELEQARGESHSGVDQLLYDSSIIATREVRDEIRSLVAGTIPAEPELEPTGSGI